MFHKLLASRAANNKTHECIVFHLLCRGRQILLLPLFSKSNLMLGAPEEGNRKAKQTNNNKVRPSLVGLAGQTSKLDFGEKEREREAIIHFLPNRGLLGEATNLLTRAM